MDLKPEIVTQVEQDGIADVVVAQRKYEDALIFDMAQLREQATYAFLGNPDQESFIMLYTRGMRFTAFKWERSQIFPPPEITTTKETSEPAVS